MKDSTRRSKLPIVGIAAAAILLMAVGIYLTGITTAEAADASTQQTETAANSDDNSSDSAAQEAEAVASEDKDDEGEKDEKAAIPVQVAEISRGTVSAYISATANLVPENEVKVLSEAAGRIAELKVEEGDRISKGQVLAVLARDEAEIALNKARLRGQNAELAYDRASGTRRQGLISSEEFDRLKMEWDVAQQEIAEAEWRLGKTTIRSPFSGRVTERLVNQGQHVSPNEEVFSVADFDPLVARIYLSERDVLSLNEGREVRISLAADAELRCAGRVSQISPVVDTATGTVKVTIEAIRPPAQVRPGAFVTIDIARERKEAALLLPRESVIRELRSAHVFVAHGSEAVKRAVTLGIEEGDMVEALTGIEEGDQVVIAGQGSLKPGAKIKIL